MCGIAGIIGLDSDLAESDLSAGRKMTDMLRHRGPDATGYLSDNRCFFGNTRLSIIDLSDNASLPMQNHSEDIWLAYNGEITNFRELVREHDLDKRYRFRSTSDTEVLLHLYQEMGISCLAELSGMFAFALRDMSKGKIWIARDFFGTRPLFWMKLNGKLYFSSEIKSFMEIPEFNPRADREAAFHYFTLAYIPGTLTAFDGVNELDGGHLLEIDTSTGKVTGPVEYYRIRFRPDSGMTLEEAEKGFYRAIRDAVDRNLISDAPIGTTLSGGLDSSSILGLSRELGRSSELHSFSLRINEKSFDESRYQRIMAGYAGSIHHEITVNPENVMESLYGKMAYMDEPIGDGAAIPFMLLSREARKYVKVLLSGEGGDEISNAYETHMANYVARKYRRFVPGFLRRMNRELAGLLPVSHSKLSFDFLAKRFTRGAELPAPEAHIYYRHVLSEREKARLMPHDSGFRATEEIFTDMFDSLDYESDLDRLAHIDMKYFFIDDLMQKNDRMFMANSVEARFPFMDRKAVEFFTTIPSKYKIRGLTRRYVEKRAMARVLPDAVRKRQNFGIELPHSSWFSGEFIRMVQDHFTPERVERTELFSYPFVKSMWNDHIAKKRDNGRALWCILNYIIWFEMFVLNRNFREHM